MNWQGLVAVVAALAAVLYCGHDPVCHENLPYIGGLAATVVGIVGGLAKQDQAKRRKHRSSDSFPPGGTIPPSQRKDSAA